MPELAHSLKQYFSVEIPTPVSEKLHMVGDVAVWFSQQLGLAGQQSVVRTTLAAQLLAELPAGTIKATPFS